MDIRNVRAFNIRSGMNEWIDFLVEVISDDYERAKEIAAQAYEEWHNSDTIETVFDFVQQALVDAGISADVYVLNE